jgi:hypothetical protein
MVGHRCAVLRVIPGVFRRAAVAAADGRDTSSARPGRSWSGSRRCRGRWAEGGGGSGWNASTVESAGAAAMHLT